MMEMDDNKLKRFLQSELDKEADIMMEQINKDPSMADVVAPDEMFDKLWAQIREYEKSKVEDGRLSVQERELIRLGEIYQKKRNRRKYYVLAVAVVCMLAFGITSLGDGKKVIQEVKDMIAGKTQIITDTNGERTDEVKIINEVETYEEIDKTFGFYPVQMDYIPEGMKLVDAVIEEELQMARLQYADKEGRSILYCMITNYRTSSFGDDIEDEVIREYEKDIQGVCVKFKEYDVRADKTKWSIEFISDNTMYSVTLIGLEQDEVEKIAKNLFFL